VTLLADRPMARGPHDSHPVRRRPASQPGRNRPGPSWAGPELLGVLVVGVVVALAGVGAALAAVLLTQGAGDTGSKTAAVLTTGTGTLEVGALSVSLKHDPKDMIGMPAGHDEAAQATVMVPVTLTNTTAEPVSYSPGQFRLLAGDTEVAPGAAAAPAQTLRPHAAITLRLTFGSPTAERSRLRYSPAAGSPVVADLGPIAQPSAPAGPQKPAQPGVDRPHQPSPAPAKSSSGGHPAEGPAANGHASTSEDH
jgi:hypothetical protein